jgi:hypothetical protein
MNPAQISSTPLTNKRIFKYWLPLALSWIMMSFETPFINATMARLSEVERMIAAFGVVYAIGLLIESPVISLLPTSTALARSKQSYLTIRRFTLHLMLLTTALHILVAWTPLFDLVIIRWMKVPYNLVEPIRLGLKIMIFWSAAIAWRRLMQGILIRNGLTKYIGQGTILRLVGSAGTAALLAALTDIPGIAVGTISLSTGVIAEAIFAHTAARKTIHEEILFPAVPPPDEEQLSYLGLVKFQIPLALSNMIYLAASPLITTALARGVNPIQDLAAWPVVNSMLFILRAPAVALPEAVIALYTSPEREKPRGQFSQGVGMALSGILLIMGVTPLAGLYFTRLIGVSPALTETAVSGAQAGVFLPLMTALLYYYRGILTAQKLTVPITVGMVVELIVMAIVLLGGIFLNISGVIAAAAALTAGIAVDALLMFIYIKTNRERRVYEAYNPGIN